MMLPGCAVPGRCNNVLRGEQLCKGCSAPLLEAQQSCQNGAALQHIMLLRKRAADTTSCLLRVLGVSCAAAPAWACCLLRAAFPKYYPLATDTKHRQGQIQEMQRGGGEFGPSAHSKCLACSSTRLRIQSITSPPTAASVGVQPRFWEGQARAVTHLKAARLSHCTGRSSRGRGVGGTSPTFRHRTVATAAPPGSLESGPHGHGWSHLGALFSLFDRMPGLPRLSSR
jgi:hypothetical protein